MTREMAGPEIRPAISVFHKHRNIMLNWTFQYSLITCLLAVSASVLSAMDPPYRPDLTEGDRTRVATATAPPSIFTQPEPFEQMPGGSSTFTGPVDAGVLSRPAPSLEGEDRLDFELGNSLFEKLWVASPSSTKASDGLGPLYNARSCHGCHVGDGRGSAELDPDTGLTTLLLRLSIWDEGAHRAHPDPVYGGQLQPLAVTGMEGEGRVGITFREFQVPLAGGETATLRAPDYAVDALAYGPLADGIALSPRIAPPMTGLGLLEAIHPDDLQALADPDDLDGDGISGRIAWVPVPDGDGQTIGRFGWKASQPSVEQQSAAALSNDLGLSSDLFPQHWGDCTEDQSNCRALPHGGQDNLGGTEAPAAVLSLITHYAANLAVPPRRDVDAPQVLHGKALFHDAGCADCHWPKFVTRRDATRPNHRFQLIWPYTDLLLHDMGDGLADHAPSDAATGREWRTPPLWGIGLAQTVDPRAGFLHDGRARTLLEAILWHGGEAAASLNAVIDMSPQDRRYLLSFLESL